ncbi:MAG: hypothetical protein P8M21_06000 [Halioglobus sp.]|nr:hypothetical protein [Halioglobus sp.]
MDLAETYAQGFFNVGMELYFCNRTLVSIPSAEVMYTLPFQLTRQDPLHLAWRCAENVSIFNASYIKKKWGIDICLFSLVLVLVLDRYHSRLRASAICKVFCVSGILLGYCEE